MPSPERFAVIRKLLEDSGWRLDRISGSHHVFVMSGQTPVVIPVHRGKVKPFYAHQVRKIVKAN